MAAAGLESDYVRLQDLINHLRSSAERAKIWAELAQRCFIAKRSDEGKRILAEHVKSGLHGIHDTEQSYYLRDRFTRQQRADMVSRLEKIATAEFPDLKNICYDGYKITAQAQIARIRQVQQANSQESEDIGTKARAIPNLADRVWVLAMLGSAMPSGEYDKERELSRRQSA